MKILIIDESDSFRQSLRSLLFSSWPCSTVYDARNATEAIYLIRGVYPDAVFLDTKITDASFRRSGY